MRIPKTGARKALNKMQRFNPGDAVFILPKFAHLYVSHSAIVVSVKTDRFRPMFNEYTVEFAGGSVANLFEFQLIEDLPNYKTLIADVLFDSRQQMATTKARGRTTGTQIIFQTEDFDIDLRIQVGRSRASLMGQVLERDTATPLKHVAVRLMKEGTPVSMTTSDSVGVFKFTDVPRGSLNILAIIPRHLMRVLGEFVI
jgi:hypothetical protein